MAMDIRRLPPHVWLADYDTNQAIARFRGNRTIESLPRTLDEGELFDSLVLTPDYTPESRNLPSHVRIQEVAGLTNYMTPLAMHIEFAFKVDTMIREGYVGRRPLSRDHIEIYQNIHELKRQGVPFRQSADTVTPAISASLLGPSGMGKTTTARRVLARFPQVIYHEELDLFQVTYLHVETPSDGKGVKSLAMAIISQLADLIPWNDYREKHLARDRTGEYLTYTAAQLMNKHCVGLLVADEIQNVGNANKQDKILMSELTRMCNLLKVPQLYIGTNKAAKILGLELRQARRGLGTSWEGLPRWDWVEVDGELKQVPGEWEDFIRQLWSYQWTKKHAALTPEILDTIYRCTQGIIDLALKLFILSQTRAILDQSEILTDALLRDVYMKDMKLVHPMVEALLSGDPRQIARFEDIGPIGADTMAESLVRRFTGNRSPAASMRPRTPGFQTHLAAAAQALGVPAETAASLASEVESDGSARNLLDGAAQLVSKLAPRKRVASKSKKGKAAAAPDFPDLKDRPDDYRNAVAYAAREKTSIHEQMVKLGMLADIDELFNFA